MGVDFQSLRDAYLAERARYEKLATWIGDVLRDALHAAGANVEVAARAKETASLVRKAIRKGYDDPLTQITDKAGVRLLVAGLSQRDEVRQLVRDTFDVIEETDKADLLQPNELGYLGVHFLVQPRLTSLAASDLDLEGLVCEVQVHTRAQHVWSDLSHAILYKPIGVVPSPAIQRRIMRLMALIEYFDLETDGAERQLQSEPGYRQSVMLEPLEREFTYLVAKDYDRQLSMRILQVVIESYDEAEIQDFSALIATFVQSHRDQLRAIFTAYGTDPDSANPLLFQPEMLAIYERLTNKPALLKARWQQQLDLRLLQTLADALGKPV